MKKIEDYIHLLIGCEVFGTYNDNSGSKGILTGVTNGGHECEIQFFLEDGINVEEEPEWNETKEVKPILRRLSSMTEEEAREIWNSTMEKTYKFNHIDRLLLSVNRIEVIAPVIPKLLAKSFDLFELIDSNLAIDRATLKS